jgi:DeoR family transcriptional regulator, aga operon transcriptional repressor
VADALPEVPARGSARAIRARRDALLRLVHLHGSVEVAVLGAALGASSATVRRDLAALERQAFVDRTWGGASAHVAVRYGDAFARRAARGARGKYAVALAAAAVVEPNMVVGLSGGTTCTLLARMLRGRPINVVTNATNVAVELYGSRPTKVILTGGALKANSYELVGPGADTIIRKYHIDVFFFSCSGIDATGFSRRDHAEAAVVRTFREAARRSVILVDRGKFGRVQSASIAALGEVDTMIVDGPLGEPWRTAFTGAGIEVIEVPTAAHDVPDAAGNRR